MDLMVWLFDDYSPLFFTQKWLCEPRNWSGIGKCILGKNRPCRACFLLFFEWANSLETPRIFADKLTFIVSGSTMYYREERDNYGIFN